MAKKVEMQARQEHAALVDVIRWIDERTAGLEFETDERKLIALACFDLVLEHQAAMAELHALQLYGSALALLRVLVEALVRGLWLLRCASDLELRQFKRGELKKNFAMLIQEVEKALDEKTGILSRFKKSAWNSLNGFTHTGFNQITRRHKPGRLEGSYSDGDLSKALGVAGALGLVAAGQLVVLSGKDELLPEFNARMDTYAKLHK